MPRRAKPRWHAARERWYMAVGPPDARGWATEVYAPPSIGPDDEAGAWAWFRARETRGTLGDVASPPPAAAATVEQAVQTYVRDVISRVDQGRLSPAHARAKTAHLEHVRRAFGATLVVDLRAEAVEAWLATLDRSAHYRANIAATVTAAARWASDQALWPGGQSFTVRAPTLPKNAERFGSRREAAVWLWWLWRVAGRSNMALLQRCLIRTGARPGELCAATWGDVRWDAGRTSTGASYAKIVLPVERWKAGKATGRTRTIYLTPALTRALRRGRPGKASGTPKVAIFAPGEVKARPDTLDRWESGSRLSRAVLQLRRRLIRDAAVARGRVATGEATPLERALAAVEWTAEGPQRLTNYRWRHTAISSLLMLGLSAETVAALTGTSAELVRSTYGHLLDEHLARAAEALRDVGRTHARKHPRPRTDEPPRA